MSENRDRLKSLLVRDALRENKVVLQTGQVSNYFISVPAVTLTAEGARLVGEVFLEKFKECALVSKVVAGSETAISVAIAVAIASAVLGEGGRMDAFFIRKRQGRLLIDACNDQKSIVLVEGIITSGLSTVDLIKMALELRYKVKAVVTLVDREEGAAGRVKQFCPFFYVFRAQELFDARGQEIGYNIDEDKKLLEARGG